MTSLSIATLSGALLSGVALVLALPDGAVACTFAPPSYLTIEIDPTDFSAPSPPEVGTILTSRSERGSSCGDYYASVSIEVSATDDKTQPEDIGYLLSAVEGEEPVFLPDKPLLSSKGWVHVSFADHGHERDVVVDIRSLDRTGNRSEQTRVRVHIDERIDEDEDSGSGAPGFGCAASDRSRGATLPWLMLVGALAWSRRGVRRRG